MWDVKLVIEEKKKNHYRLQGLSAGGKGRRVNGKNDQGRKSTEVQGQRVGLFQGGSRCSGLQLHPDPWQYP